MSKFNEGDDVEITVKAKVTYASDDYMEATYYSDGFGADDTPEEVTVALDSDAVTVKRVAPEMKAGDVYADNDGDAWITQDSGDLINEVGVMRTVTYVTENYGPLTLVYRKVEDAA